MLWGVGTITLARKLNKEPSIRSHTRWAFRYHSSVILPCLMYCSISFTLRPSFLPCMAAFAIFVTASLLNPSCHILLCAMFVSLFCAF